MEWKWKKIKIMKMFIHHHKYNTQNNGNNGSSHIIEKSNQKWSTRIHNSRKSVTILREKKKDKSTKFSLVSLHEQNCSKNDNKSNDGESV